MGDVADIALAQCELFESLADDYISGEMSCEDAFEYGFLDSMGREVPELQEAWNRSIIGGRETLTKDLQHQITRFELQTSGMGNTAATATTRIARHNKQQLLNEEAINNLAREYPTCNVCRKPMQARNGKFGRFYYCKCPNQPTVSDKYWQSVKTKG